MLIKYDPFRDLRLISDTLINEIFKDPCNINVGKGFPIYDQTIQEDGSVVLEFPLAGYKKDELSIKIEDNQLQISATKKADIDTTGKYPIKNIARRSFSKTLIAADDLDLDAITASFEDGLLQIKIPSRHRKPPEVRTIAIK